VWIFQVDEAEDVILVRLQACWRTPRGHGRCFRAGDARACQPASRPPNRRLYPRSTARWGDDVGTLNAGANSGRGEEERPAFQCGRSSGGGRWCPLPPPICLISASSCLRSEDLQSAPDATADVWPSHTDNQASQPARSARFAPVDDYSSIFSRLLHAQSVL